MIRISPVIKRLLGCLPAAFFLGGIPLPAANSTATVTESVNEVVHGSSQSAGTAPAKVGTSIPDGEYLKTGVKSRAELELADQSITRLGANTIFNYSVANNEIDLQAGTVLFSKPKDGREMTIKTASVTAAVVGTTGFLSLHGHDFLFGLIEGHATLTEGGVGFKVSSGEILRFSPGSRPELYDYNLPVFLKTSPLISQFNHPLPNQVYIDREVAAYDNLVARGFIQPPGPTLIASEFGGSVPGIPIVAHDSAGNSLHEFLTPPPAPPPPPPPDGGPSDLVVHPSAP